MDEKIRAEFFSRRFSLMQGTILGQIDEELDDDVFVKLITAYFHTVKRVCPSIRRSVGRPVGPLRLCENRVSRLFLATVISYTETNDQPTCF